MFLNVVHLLLRLGDAIDLLDQLLQRHRVQHFIGGDSKPLADEADGDLAGRAFAAGGVIAGGEAAFEAAKQVADCDVLGGTGKTVSPPAAYLAFQESAATEGEENGFEEFIGQTLQFR
jgi:hypothetical protein